MFYIVFGDFLNNPLSFGFNSVWQKTPYVNIFYFPGATRLEKVQGQGLCCPTEEDLHQRQGHHGDLCNGAYATAPPTKEDRLRPHGEWGHLHGRRSSLPTPSHSTLEGRRMEEGEREWRMIRCCHSHFPFYSKERDRLVTSPLT
jgi:hypothetical protein